MSHCQLAKTHLIYVKSQARARWDAAWVPMCHMLVMWFVDPLCLCYHLFEMMELGVNGFAMQFFIKGMHEHHRQRTEPTYLG